MWKVASQAITGGLEPNNILAKPSDCSDDEVFSNTSREEGLECPVCWEYFNIVENVPYVLWCGHTLCKNCVVRLPWTVAKFLSIPVQLPLFISCPWCLLLSFRLVYKGNLTFPCKNFFLLWMVESMNGDSLKSHSSSSNQPISPYNRRLLPGSIGYHNHNVRRAPYSNQEQSQANSDQAGSLAHYLNAERINASLRKSLVFFIQLTAKFPLVVFFLLIVLYAVPAGAAIIVLFIVVTILLAIPSFLILYFAYPSLDWLIKEIIN